MWLCWYPFLALSALLDILNTATEMTISNPKPRYFPLEVIARRIGESTCRDNRTCYDSDDEFGNGFTRNGSENAPVPSMLKFVPTSGDATHIWSNYLAAKLANSGQHRASWVGVSPLSVVWSSLNQCLLGFYAAARARPRRIRVCYMDYAFFNTLERGSGQICNSHLHHTKVAMQIWQSLCASASDVFWVQIRV
jgi:hypothetical protein